MLQPYELFNFYKGLLHPNTVMPDPVSWQYFGKMSEYIPGSSFFATVWGNLTNGKQGVLNWTWENGRVFQTASLFMLGMLAGRKNLFISSNESISFWKKTLMIAILVFVPMFILKNSTGNWIESEAVRRPLITIFSTWSNLAFMLILVSGFTLLFEKTFVHRILIQFSPIGRMSLSNYIMQSMMGSFIYYGFGLSMYLYTGATYSIIIGIGLASIQWLFCKWWLKNHKQGPLELIWHKATWIRS